MGEGTVHDQFSEARFEEDLQAAITDNDQVDYDSVQTFEEVAMLTQHRGLVVRLANGAEFQVTIVKSRPGYGEAL